MGEQEDIARAIDATHARACSAEHDLLLLAAQADTEERWRVEGARDAAHWLSMRFGVSTWKARRWIAAGKALPSLPTISSAFAEGRIGVDKALQLARFATADTEGTLLSWALRVNCSTVRQKADTWNRKIEAERDAHHARFLRWWPTDDGQRLCIEGEVPIVQGKILANALDRMASEIPSMPDEDVLSIEARRADALIALASARVARDPDPDRATVVVHAELEGLLSGQGGCEMQGGPALHPDTVKRLLCNARTQTIVEDRAGNARFVSAMKRNPLHGCFGRFATATAVASSQGAARRSSPKLTTSGSGATAAEQNSRTSRSSARFTTDSCTKTAGPWPEAPTESSSGVGQAACVTAPVPAQGLRAIAKGARPIDSPRNRGCPFLSETSSQLPYLDEGKRRTVPNVIARRRTLLFLAVIIGGTIAGAAWIQMGTSVRGTLTLPRTCPAVEAPRFALMTLDSRGLEDIEAGGGMATEHTEGGGCVLSFSFHTKKRTAEYRLDLNLDGSEGTGGFGPTLTDAQIHDPLDLEPRDFGFLVKRAESSLRNAMIIGKSYFTEIGTYEGFTPEKAASIEPLSISWNDSLVASTESVSIRDVSPTTALYAMRSDGGTVFCLAFDAAKGATFGEVDAQAVSECAEPSW